jgi:hypothetical protein
MRTLCCQSPMCIPTGTSLPARGAGGRDPLLIGPAEGGPEPVILGNLSIGFCMGSQSGRA